MMSFETVGRVSAVVALLARVLVSTVEDSRTLAHDWYFLDACQVNGHF